MDNLSMKFDRKNLYDEIWESSLTGVSKKYGLNYAKLIQACKDNNIPYPSAAYWTKKNMGLDYSKEIVKLPEAEEKIINVQLKTNGNIITELPNDENKFINEFKFLNFLEEEEKKKIAKVIYNLNVYKFKRYHKIINDYKKQKQEERRQERKDNYFNPYYDIHKYNENGYFQNVSKVEKSRCMKILSLIYFAIEELGGTINNDFSLEIRGENVKLQIEEQKDQINHELTKDEAKRLLEYEEEKKKRMYAYKPNIRKYDYVYNGKLKITCGYKKYVRETDKIKLEDKLGDIIIKLYEQSEEVKKIRIEKEEIERIAREEREKEKKIKSARREEAKRVIQLVNMSEDYEIACKIRNYINAVSNQENLANETIEWLKWANKKANWFDPTINEEDEFLGKREHEKSNHDKNHQLDNYASYYDWHL